MARKVVLDTYYTFTPGASGVGSVVINRAIPRERLILITNVSSNQVIYNFSDPNLRASSYTIATDANNNTTTTVTLAFDTSAMNSADKLQITVDEYEETFKPAEIFQDPVNKLRVSQPQALIDTDFEYGTQVTKWENVSLTNQRPFAFFSSGNAGIPGIQFVTIPTGSRTVTVGLATVGAIGQFGLTTSAAPPVGTPFNIQDTYLNICNGNFVVESVAGIGSTLFTYTAKAANTSTTVTNVLDSGKTGIYTGSFYTGAGIGTIVGLAYTSTNIAAGCAVTVTTSVGHGLVIGNEIAVTGLVTSAGQTVNGNFTVATVLGPTTFTYYTPNIPVGVVTFTSGTVYVRPQSQFLHRPADGGVVFSTESTSSYQSASRQTRRYFRYQSGKGIQVSSGTILKPNFAIESLTAAGTGSTTVTVITKEQHNLQAAVFGTNVIISGANEAGFNTTTTVTTINGPNSFSYNAVGIATTVASGNYSANVLNWYGSSNRLGIFDQQNGIFFEYDGNTLYAVRRSSTFQIAGRVNVTQGSHTVSRSDANLFPTAFSKQLVPGDRVVIRGQSYRVLEVNDTASTPYFAITPAYRGPSASFLICSKTIDLKIPQSQWNLDRCDGTGPSGFNINLSKMQMFYIDYSWYGAGFIRWGFRGTDGNVIYCHKLPNNNINSEAYMRSGNLPARYESMSEPPYTLITQTIQPSDTTISVNSTTGFPSAGVLLIRPSDTGNYEYVNYTGITTNSFTGVIRAKPGITTSIVLSGLGTNQNVATATTAGLQVGHRIIGPNIPERTYIGSLGIGTIFLSQAVTGVASSATIPPLGIGVTQTFTYNPSNPKTAELAYPSFSPTVSHWGTSVIMDGQFDNDKSLVFTYGQTGISTISPNASRVLLAIRISPSVDNGVAAAFATRELINRMQLTLKSLDITSTSNANLLVRAYLNTPVSAASTWTSATNNAAYIPNSSLAQIADYSISPGLGTTVTALGGEVTAGFYVNGTTSIDLSNVRDLGNSVLGGGGTNTNTQIYPDGPDVLTIVVTNLTGSNVGVSGRLSWTEAQA